MGNPPRGTLPSIPDALREVRLAREERELAEARAHDALVAYRDAMALARLAGARTASIASAAGISRQRVNMFTRNVVPIEE